MTTNPFDMTKLAEDFLNGLKIDNASGEDAAAKAAEFNSKLAKILLDATKQNAKLTNAWTKDTLKSLESKNKVTADPAQAAETLADLAKEGTEAVQKNISAYTEVAKAAQEQTMQLFLKASQDLQAEILKQSKKS